ncbi:tetratricopeptide repeat protein [Marinobacter apostichopi]|uniref:tetratricopeptide repeat protein n=1 Tax=Marinobacter apostichopi TaxID=3035454 RepID=UPI0025728ABF|nr:tetratricopeptide repeat protein [Marinobacter sp. LA51]
MNWGKPITVAMLLALLSGCALSPGQDDAPASPEAEGQQAQLAEDFQAAVALKQEGDLEAARDRFGQLAEQYPTRTGPHANLGILAYEAGDTEQASAHFDAVLTLDDSHPVALNHLGVIAREAGEFEAAEDYYRRALDADPNHLPAMLNLAFLLDIYLGRPGDALPLYEQYQSQATDPNPRLEDWIFDAKNRL